MKLSITVIILTLNEELNIEKCLKSVSGWVSEIIVVDSYSTDKTLEIAKRYNARVVQHKFKHQSDQFNWALDNIDIKNEWIFKLDADEEILPELKEEIINTLPKTREETTGFYIKRRNYFMGKWIKHGGYYPVWFLRLWRRGKARVEDREMDEHVFLLEGEAKRLKEDFIDNNKRGLKYWIAKHKDYSNREVKELLKAGKGKLLEAKIKGSQAEKKRWLKEKLYYRLPLFIRPGFYFVYRYFFKLGFLDGVKGLVFHFLQGFWYRFLIDVKILKMKKQLRNKGK